VLFILFMPQYKLAWGVSLLLPMDQELNKRKWGMVTQICCFEWYRMINNDIWHWTVCSLVESVKIFLTKQHSTLSYYFIRMQLNIVMSSAAFTWYIVHTQTVDVFWQTGQKSCICWLVVCSDLMPKPSIGVPENIRTGMNNNSAVSENMVFLNFC
jgi:hypothetical protein